jgi:hypothetical protein
MAIWQSIERKNNDRSILAVLQSPVRHSGLMAVALVHTLGHIAMRILVCLVGMNIEEFIQL